MVVREFHRIKFFNTGGREVGLHLDFDTLADCEAKADEIAADDDHPAWPEYAVRLKSFVMTEERPVEGVDFGKGSAKRRVGGGRVPRGMTQYR